VTREFLETSEVGAPARALVDWHFRPGAIERLAPPWQPLEIVEAAPRIEDGARTTLRAGFGPVRLDWIAEHCEVRRGEGFRDVQVAGPFAAWEHSHRALPLGPGRSALEDAIRYELPLGRVGEALGGAAVAAQLRRLFRFRHRITRDDLAAHGRYQGEPMRIAVTGSSGLIGSALTPFLTTGGHEVRRLVRRPPRARDELRWDPRGGVDPSALEGVSAVVHLAGESIGEGRWTRRSKARIKESRVAGTRLLSEGLARMTRPPEVLVCASAIGYYGDRGDETLTENSPAGEGFLAELCRAWEAAALPAREAGIRIVHLRLGVILDPRGGALARMLTPFRLGVGGRVGSGRQWMSWVSLEDAVDAFHHALGRRDMSGVYNVVAPAPVRNAELTRVLARVLGRPALAPVPAFAARLAFGEMAEALLLASARVSPERLEQTGFSFRHPDLEGALRHVLGRVAA